MTKPSMRALEMQDIGRLELVERPVPMPGPGEVLVQTLATTICTSDIVDLAENAFGGPVPRILGHESAGVVTELGAGVKHFKIGQRVAVHPVFPCGKCERCRHGMEHLCLDMGHLGLNWPGTFAEYFRARADRVAVIPNELNPAVAALLEPCAVCLQALRRGRVQSGETILIVGDGPFGLLISRLAVRQGAKVIIAGQHKFRLDRAQTSFTIHEPSNPDPLSTLREMAGAEGADVAILCAASESALKFACSALRARGRLVIFAALTKPAPVDLFSVHVKELEIVGACNDEEQLDQIVPLLSDKHLVLHELITHRLPLEEYETGFRLASSARDQTLKVAFVMGTAA